MCSGSLSCVWLSAIPWTVAHQAPVHGILQARILEWVAISFSKGSSCPRDQTHMSYLARGSFTTEPPGSPLSNTGVLQSKIHVNKTRTLHIKIPLQPKMDYVKNFTVSSQKRWRFKTVRNNIAIKSEKPKTHHFLSPIQISYLNNWHVPKDIMPCLKITGFKGLGYNLSIHSQFRINTWFHFLPVVFHLSVIL